MKILWIPHGTWLKSVRQRDQYFIEKLKDKHEIHTLTWSEPKGPRIRYFLNPIIHIKALQEWSKRENGVYLLHFRRVCLSRFSMVRNINEHFFQKKIREIIKEYNIDIIICGPNYYLNGFPPFDINIPIIFDYLDYVSNEAVKRVYLEKSDAVLCASNVLQEESKRYNKNSFYLPNGVDLNKFKKANPERIRSKYGLENTKIVSLIGLTCSKTLYFLDALPEIKKSVPNIKYLIVGDNYLLPKMRRKVKKFSGNVIFTGWVDYTEIQDYFATSDVGIYPVDKNIYFDSASPIKIFEYTAAKKPVVSVDLKELKCLNFPNVLYAKPSIKDFSEKIIEALNKEYEYPESNQFDWGVLASRLEEILEKTVKQ